MAFDVTARDWSDEVLKRADVARELLPSAYPSGTYVGKVGVKVAGEVGFRDGVVVATGGHDQPCGALGAGITQPGMAMNATGTSEVICPAFSRPVLNRNMLAANYCCYPHVSEDSYCSIGFNLTGGLLLRWYRDVLCGEEMAEAKRRSLDPYELILSKMSVDSRDLFIMPHFVGTGTPELNASARGAIWGLTLDTDKSHLTRAVIDSLNYEMKLNIDRMEEAGVQIDELRAIGGGAKSDKWLQMKADVFGKPVASLAVSEAASFGSALLAGKAVGVYESVAEASKRLVRVREVFEPDTARHRDYEQRYRKYVEIRDLFKALRSGLAGF
jgi:xylulokinase